MLCLLTSLCLIDSSIARKHRDPRSFTAADSKAVGPNYDLGIHFFDKRMMIKAEVGPNWGNYSS